VSELLIRAAHDFAGVTVPLTALFAFLLPLAYRVVGHRRFPLAYAFAVTCFVAVATTTIYFGVFLQGKPIVYAFGGWPPPIGISYEIDHFNAMLGLYAGWILVGLMLFNAWYDKNLDEPDWYYTLFLGFEAGVLGCFYTGDAFNLFVMIEVLSISVYGLVAYHKSNPGSLEAAVKYAMIGATATTVYFVALVVIYGFYGSLNMADILYKNTRLFYMLNFAEVARAAVVAATLAVSLSLWVFTFKAGLFPNHFWIPDVYSEAPAPVASALSALSEVVGVYAVIRFLYTVFPVESPLSYAYRSAVLAVLLVLGFIGGVVGALMTLVQRDIRRLYGYSTVSHIGLLFMTLAIGFTTSDDTVLKIAFTAVQAHVIAHGFSKLLLFASTQVLVEAGGSKIMDDLRGVGRKYPLVSTALTMGFLNLMGAIPFLGFFSKLLMYQAYMASGQVLPAIGIVVVSALSIPGYAKALYSLVFSTPVREHRSVDAGWFKYYLAVIAALLLALGLAFTLLYRTLDSVAYNSLTRYGYLLYRDRYLEVRGILMGGG